MIIKDDRTQEQKQTHTIGIAATDKFLSGWGMAEGGMSYAVWACTPENYAEVEYHIKQRPEMKRVRIVDLRNYAPRDKGHCHIYVARESPQTEPVKEVIPMTNEQVKQAFIQGKEGQSTNLVSRGTTLCSYGWWEVARWVDGEIITRVGPSYSTTATKHRSGVIGRPASQETPKRQAYMNL